MGGEDSGSALANRVDARCGYNTLDLFFARRIVSELDALLNEHNELLKIFKSHMHKLVSDNHAIVINPDKTPAGEHIRRFNAPVADDVAGIKVGDRTGAETNENSSSKDYYAYRLMIRRGLDNVILRFRELCQQFMVDMYVKIEGERLRYLRYNQLKLRVKEYTHLRDAIVNNADAAEIGNSVILPSSYVGSSRHMQDYIQDALTFVCEYGRPCLFITFTCNPKWPEITSLLLPGQNAIHRHDITARVFRQKLKSLINFITKPHVFGPTRCWLYSIEWQKRALPHAHILVWLIDKIRPEDIDNIISAEIPDPSSDQLLFDIVTANMVHGSCGTFNRSSPCMSDEKCTKNFPKDFTNDTITNVDGYSIYCRRNPDNGGQSFIKNISNTDIDIDNSWVVPYSPLLSKTYNAHINVEFCSSVKSIKYICKYVHKGSDMAVLRVENTNVNAPPVNKNDEITLCQIGRYISSNAAVWRIFGFTIHERDPAVVQLAVHLENGQRVYFTNETAIDRAINPPKTTLTEFFELCNRADDFGAFAPRAEILWDNHKDSMTDDILHQHRTRCNDLAMIFSDDIYNEALIAIEDLCIIIANLPLSHFGKNSPNRGATDLMNTEMNREMQYTTVETAAIVTRNVPLMNEEQRTIYDRIMLAVSAGQGGFFFLDAPGGIGKTFLISLILAKIRSNNGIALAVASSGIAATLLDEGRPAHSVFKLPLNIQNNPDAVCNMKKQSSIATVLKQFLSGDFRQTFPVIPRSTYADEINACLKSSTWRSIEIVQLKVNMRVQVLQDPSAETFSKQLLDIGDGKVTIAETGYIKLANDFCTIIDLQDALIEQIFPDVHTNNINLEWLSERAIFEFRIVSFELLSFEVAEYVGKSALPRSGTISHPVSFDVRRWSNPLRLPGGMPRSG
ncbi:uncharacterized protein LOC123274158 [Cotesia glomerata]|uniref:uncharacterized protein LOC123274158 n=1 Tax=Cotesia glomerata TaxID=32391 RepID=UPI001D023679|nr:uncharacterized protein LOC123274158 [Cotesia glomerata]